MKSEERHKLQRNVLAHWLADAYGRWRPIPVDSVGGAASLTVLVVVTWWRNHAATSSAAASDRLFSASGDTEKLDELATESPTAASAFGPRWRRPTSVSIAAAGRRSPTAPRRRRNCRRRSKDTAKSSRAIPLRSSARRRISAARAYEALMGTRQGGEYYKRRSPTTKRSKTGRTLQRPRERADLGAEIAAGDRVLPEVCRIQPADAPVRIGGVSANCRSDPAHAGPERRILQDDPESGRLVEEGGRKGRVPKRHAGTSRRPKSPRRAPPDKDAAKQPAKDRPRSPSRNRAPKSPAGPLAPVEAIAKRSTPRE